MSSEIRFDHTVLENGLTVIGEHNPRAASVAVGYLVHAGSRDETPVVAGVSHFLEHMLFKGNERLSAEEINRGFDELGADYNAFTSEEQTVYYGAVVAERAGGLLELLSELMEPSLRQDDFDMEKKVILEEIAMYQDRPMRRLFEIGSSEFWAGHPLGNSVLGSTESIKELQRDDMRAYFEKRYAPSNVILAFAGNYDWEALVKRATKLTSAWRNFTVTRERPEPAPKAGLLQKTDATLSRVHGALFAPGVGIEYARRYAPAILATALGDTSGSRLYWELVDAGITDTAWLLHDSAEGAGLYLGHFTAAKERWQEVLERFQAVLVGAQEGGITKEEWRRAQRKLATTVTFRSETPLGRLMSFALPYQALGSYSTVKEVVDEVMSTGPEEGESLLARRPFSNALVMTLGPTDE